MYKITIVKKSCWLTKSDSIAWPSLQNTIKKYGDVYGEFMATMIWRLIIFDLQKNFLCLGRILIIEKLNKKHINKKIKY